MKLSTYLFDQDKQTLKSHNLCNHVTRARKKHSEAAEVFLALLIAAAFLAAYSASQRWTRSDVENRAGTYIPISEAQDLR